MTDKIKNKKFNNISGFTLAELLVTISIIALLSSITLVNYHNTNKRSEINVVKQKVSSDIRLAQNYSLGSKTYDGTNTPAGGWGARFDLSSPSAYIIFADISGNKAYDAGEAIETKTLPSGITISSLSPAGPLDIVFLPPDPVTYVNGLDNASAQIILKEDINNSTVGISVNSFGLIDTN